MMEKGTKVKLNCNFFTLEHSLKEGSVGEIEETFKYMNSGLINFSGTKILMHKINERLTKI